MSETPAALIGLDIGGSKTHAALIVDGKIVREAITGSANVQSVSPEDAARNLGEAYERLGSPSVASVYAGSAGVDTEADVARLRALIEGQIPGARVDIVHDTRLILAAAELHHGIGVVVGTGTVAWGVNEAGAQARSGGWGYLLGDEGSGYWIAIRAVRHALGRMDDGLEPDELTRELLLDCGLEHPADLIYRAYSSADRRYWAQRAGLVYRRAAAGDAAARAIVDGANDALAAMIVRVARRLDSKGPVALGGGLAMHQPAVLAGVSERLAAHGIDDVRVLEHEPVYGAAWISTH